MSTESLDNTQNVTTEPTPDKVPATAGFTKEDLDNAVKAAMEKARKQEQSKLRDELNSSQQALDAQKESVRVLNEELAELKQTVSRKVDLPEPTPEKVEPTAAEVHEQVKQMQEQLAEQKAALELERANLEKAKDSQMKEVEKLLAQRDLDAYRKKKLSDNDIPSNLQALVTGKTSAEVDASLEVVKATLESVKVAAAEEAVRKLAPNLPGGLRPSGLPGIGDTNRGGLRARKNSLMKQKKNSVDRRQKILDKVSGKTS